AFIGGVSDQSSIRRNLEDQIACGCNGTAVSAVADWNPPADLLLDWIVGDQSTEIAVFKWLRTDSRTSWLARHPGCIGVQAGLTCSSAIGVWFEAIVHRVSERVPTTRGDVDQSGLR